MTEETNRDRVRRLLFVPLGFRWPKGTPDDKGKADLDGIADDLSYLADDDLAAMARMMAPHGEGSARCFWPPKSSFMGFAHIVHPRPLSQDPKLLSWWASDAGQQMVQDGTLVETYQYFEKYRKPPLGDGPRAAVRDRAYANAQRLARIDERLRLEMFVPVEDAEWRRWYIGRQSDLTALVDEARAARAKGRAA